MEKDLDATFAKLAVELGMISKKSLSECLELQLKAEKLGLRENLAEIMVKKGYLEKGQADQIISQMGAQGIRGIAGFELLELLGSGGMGSVYKARQLSTQKIVAIKVLSPENSANPEFRARFIREAKAVTQLNHKNIVSGIEAGEEYGINYFAMEFVEGDCLQKLIDQQGMIPPYKALDIISQVARALEHAHSHNLVHRDIKPDNIIITKGGVAKLTDLGLAKFTTARGYDARLTQTGFIMGTPYYISPEQAKGFREVDIRTDIYSLGATFYHAITGSPPFPGDSPAEVVSRHLTEKLCPPHKVNPDIPIPFSALICKMMAKDREQRYQNPSELLMDIDKLRLDTRLPTDTVIAENIQPVIAHALSPQAMPPKKRRLHLNPIHIGLLGIIIAIFIFFLILKYINSQEKTYGKKDLKEAQLYLKEHPENLLEALLQFRKIVEKGKNTEVVHDAKEDILKILKQFSEHINILIQNDKYNESYSIFKKMEDTLEGLPYKNHLIDIARWLHPIVESRFQEKILNAWKEAQNEGFEKAKSTLAPLLEIERAGISWRTSVVISEIKRVLQEEHEKKYAEIKLQHKNMIYDREYEKVFKELGSLAQTWGELTPKNLLKDKESVSLLVEFWNRFLFNLDGIKDKPASIMLGNMLVEVTDCDKTSVRLSMGRGFKQRYTFKELPVSFIIKVYNKSPIMPDSKNEAAKGLFYEANKICIEDPIKYYQAGMTGKEIGYFQDYERNRFYVEKKIDFLFDEWNQQIVNNPELTYQHFWDLYVNYKDYPRFQNYYDTIHDILKAKGVQEIRIPISSLSSSPDFDKKWNKTEETYSLKGKDVEEAFSIPDNYLDIEIFIRKDISYRVWLKMKPAPGYELRKYSTYIQFGESLNPCGKETYRIGTKSALNFEIYTPSTYLPFWYWVSGTNYFFSSSTETLLTFSKTGSEILRIQKGVGEVLIDEIVISGEAFLKEPPD